MMSFRLVDAGSAAEAASLLEKHGPDAQPIAAGGDLLGLLKEGVAGPTLPAPGLLVNLATACDMTGISTVDGRMRIGAMTTLADIAHAAGIPPMLAEAVGRIASPQLRNRTTIGGNLLQRPRCLYFRHPDVSCFKKGGTGCPAVGGPAEAYPGALFPGLCHAAHPSDLAPALAALEAEVEIAGPGGLRRLSLIDLYEGAGSNPGKEAVLGPAEILIAITLPQRECLQAFEKLAPRDANEFASASAAVAVGLEAGVITWARLALGGIAPAPLLWHAADPHMIGRAPHEVDAEAVAAALEPSARIAAAQPARLAACRTAILRAVRRIGEVR